MIIFFWWILLVSSIGFFLMGWDKSRSRERGSRRIAENTFLYLALVGGASGIWLGMVVFRHKTQKKYFFLVVNILLFIQIWLFTLAQYQYDALSFDYVVW